MSVLDALKEVLKKALVDDRLRRGLREAAKAHASARSARLAASRRTATTPSRSSCARLRGRGIHLHGRHG